MPQTSSMRGDLQHLGLRHIDLRVDAAEAAAARLEIGDADHVVIGHGVGEVLGGLEREAVVVRRAARRHVDGVECVQPVEIFAAIVDVLKIDDLLEPQPQHLARLARELAGDARQQRLPGPPVLLWAGDGELFEILLDDVGRVFRRCLLDDAVAPSDGVEAGAEGRETGLHAAAAG